MNVDQIMTRDVVTVSMDDSLEWIQRVFSEYRFHHVVVTENGQVVGVISDRDVLKNLSPFVGKITERSQDSASLQRRAHQIMTRTLVYSDEETPVREAMQTMLRERVSCLPVVDGRRRCMGIVTWRDLLANAADMLGCDVSLAESKVEGEAA